jgi:hypothetical protein
MFYKLIVQKVSSDHNGQVLLDQTFQEDQTDQFNQVMGIIRSERKVFLAERLIIPTRTDDLIYFPIDFFCPASLEYQSQRIENAIGHIFSSLICLAVDIITFPWRVITVIPRIIYNLKHPKEDYLFYKYLKDHGVNPSDLTYGTVKVRVIEDTTNPTFVNERDFESTVNLFPVPSCNYDHVIRSSSHTRRFPHLAIEN